MLNFDRNLMNLHGTDEKLPFRGKYLRQVFVKNVVCMDKKHEMITDKVETLLRGQSDPAFQKDTK